MKTTYKVTTYNDNYPGFLGTVKLFASLEAANLFILNGARSLPSDKESYSYKIEEIKIIDQGKAEDMKRRF